MNELEERNREDLKKYFTTIIEIGEKKERFPVSLDLVWPLVFDKKYNAVRYLTHSDKFVENIDYIGLDVKENSEIEQRMSEKAESFGLLGYQFINFGFPQSEGNQLPGESSSSDPESDPEIEEEKNKGGRPTKIYRLSLPCLEYLISTRNRDVFDVYMRVFHAAYTRTEGYILTSVAKTIYNLTPSSHVEKVTDFLVSMHYRVGRGQKHPIYLNEVFSLGFPSMQDAINELRNPMTDEYVEGRDYIRVTEGEQPGYFLSFNAFDRLIVPRSPLASLAYRRAFKSERLPAIPSSLVSTATGKKDDKDIARLKKKYGISEGNKREQISAILDRLCVLYEQVESTDEAMLINNIITPSLLYGRSLGEKLEGEIE